MEIFANFVMFGGVASALVLLVATEVHHRQLVRMRQAGKGSALTDSPASAQPKKTSASA